MKLRVLIFLCAAACSSDESAPSVEQSRGDAGVSDVATDNNLKLQPTPSTADLIVRFHVNADLSRDAIDFTVEVNRDNVDVTLRDVSGELPKPGKDGRTFRGRMPWADMNRRSPIDFEESMVLEFEAIATSGADVDSQIFAVNLQCEDGTPACAATCGERRCGESCFLHDSQTGSFFTVDNCGGCGIVCHEGAECTDGQCVCPNGTELCDGKCVDLRTDKDHCGSCGWSCETSCGSGFCRCESDADCPRPNSMCFVFDGFNDDDKRCVSLGDFSLEGENPRIGILHIDANDRPIPVCWWLGEREELAAWVACNEIRGTGMEDRFEVEGFDPSIGGIFITCEEPDDRNSCSGTLKANCPTRQTVMCYRD